MKKIKMSLLFLLVYLQVLSQSNELYDNWIVTDGDLTRLNQLPSNWTLGNTCNIPYFIDGFINGDLILKDTSYIAHARLTVYGEVLGGFPIILQCESSELIIENNTLSSVSETVENIKIFPNPTSNIFHLNTNKPFKLKVYNIRGEYVTNTNNISNQPSGFYIVIITFEDNIKHILKIIKK
jgi:hypothetical protein